MKLYITAAGIYAGTQVEAKADGKGWKPEEVPTDKYGLINYLNRLKGEAFTISVASTPYSESIDREEWLEPLRQPNPVLERGLAGDDQITPEMLEGPSEGLSEARQGPKGHRIAERAALMGTSDEIALLADRIGELDGQALGQMALAVAVRFKELGKGKDLLS